MGGVNSGRQRLDVDMDAALDLIMRGEKVPAIAAELGISPPTLRSRIADIKKKQGLLLQYREVQSLQLTELQARVLEAITPEKIDESNLRDLIMCYKILKDKELVTEGKPSEIRGLVAHLIHLEKQEAVIDLPTEFNEDLDFDESPQMDIVSQLSELDDSEY